MNAKRLHRRWKNNFESRLETVRRFLRKRRALDEAEVHDLRVALRRAQLLASLGNKALGKNRAKRYRESLRAQLKALHFVRDCDVALARLRDPNASDLIKPFEQRRARLWRTAKRTLKQVQLQKFKLPTDKKADATKLARKFAKQTEAAISRCQAAMPRGPELSLEALHALRRAVRRWRYLRELALSRREVRRDRKLKTLIEVQDALGAVQNTKAILDQFKGVRATQELRTVRTRLTAELKHQHSEARQAVALLVKVL